MGRHHIGHSRLGLLQFFYIHAVSVHRNSFNLISKGLKYLVSTLIGRFLHSNGNMPSENLLKEHKKIIRSGTDDNLIRSAIHTSRRMKIPGNGFPKSIISLGIPQGKHLAVSIHQNVFGNLFPRGKGKILKAHCMR